MDIFSRLVATQRQDGGGAPLLRPALPAHFAPRAGDAAAASALDLHEAAAAASASAPPAATRAPGDGAQAARDAARRDRPKAAATAPLARAALLPETAAARQGTGPRGDPRGALPAPMRPPANDASLDRAGREATPAGVPQRTASSGIDRSVGSVPMLVVAPGRQAAAPRAGFAGPLSAHAAQRASNTQPPAAADAPPVVHLHIDRVEVRAPAAPARPPMPRVAQRPAPETSLADYLRRSSRR